LTYPIIFIKPPNLSESLLTGTNFSLLLRSRYVRGRIFPLVLIYVAVIVILLGDDFFEDSVCSGRGDEFLEEEMLLKDFSAALSESDVLSSLVCSRIICDGL